MDAKTAVKTIMSCNRMSGNNILTYRLASEIANFIEQQEQKIEQMKCCGNCKYRPCYSGLNCVDLSKWEFRKRAELLGEVDENGQ